MNKKILSLAVMLPMFLYSFAQDDVTKEKFTPFYQMADAPHMERTDFQRPDREFGRTAAADTILCHF